jgi:hypothetical protein
VRRFAALAAVLVLVLVLVLALALVASERAVEPRRMTR